MQRALVLGNGLSTSSPQTSLERQSLALASALLKGRDHHRLQASTSSASWTVSTPWLSALPVPLPRLFRPISSQTFLQRVLSSTYFHSPAFLRPSPKTLSEAFPHPFHAPANTITPPPLVICAGPDTAAVAVASKAILNARLIHVGPGVPTGAGAFFDALVVPQYADTPDAPLSRVVHTAGPLHDVTPERISAHVRESAFEDIDNLAQPIVLVVAGREVMREGEIEDALRLVGEGGIMVFGDENGKLQRRLVREIGVERVLYDDGKSRGRWLYALGVCDTAVVEAKCVDEIAEALAGGAELLISGKGLNAGKGNEYAERLVEKGLVSWLQSIKVQADLSDLGTANESKGALSGIDDIASAVWQILKREDG